MSKKILISAGPIPGKLDSVKLITNRFRGGLMMRVARFFCETHRLVTLVRHSSTIHTIPLYNGCEEIVVEDVHEYVQKVLEKEYDAYILGAAVANIIPANPYVGKFPSHLYHEGDTFDISFTIAPRVIDRVKQKYPKATLIGYKLFENPGLIEAGTTVLKESKATAIFCNTPADAKTRKIMLTQDGAITPMTFDEHVMMLSRIIDLKWYHTEILDENESFGISTAQDLLSRIMVEKDGYRYGTVAVREKNGFVTTTRGKRAGKNGIFGKVMRVDHKSRTVLASDKMTINAPMLERLLYIHQDKNLVIHSHRFLKEAVELPYLFPGTSEEVLLPETTATRINIAGHGSYLACNLDEVDMNVFQ